MIKYGAMKKFTRLLISVCLALTVSPLVAEEKKESCAKNRILFIQDSHSLGPFGEAMDRWLVKLENTELRSIGLGGSHPRWWLEGGGTPHAYLYNSCSGEPIKNRKEVPHVKARAPYLPGLIKKGDVYERQIVIIEQGGNVPGDLNETYTKPGAEIIKAIKSREENICIWIGPPIMPVWTPEYAENVYKAIRAAINKAAEDLEIDPDQTCRLIDSRPLATYPKGTDGYHFPFTEEGIAEAKKWAASVNTQIQDILEPLGF